jgi:hypothetical protein
VVGDDFCSYVVLDATAELTPVATNPADETVDELVALHRAVADENPNWDEFRRDIVRRSPSSPPALRSRLRHGADQLSRLLALVWRELAALTASAGAMAEGAVVPTLFVLNSHESVIDTFSRLSAMDGGIAPAVPEHSLRRERGVSRTAGFDPYSDS